MGGGADPTPAKKKHTVEIVLVAIVVVVAVVAGVVLLHNVPAAQVPHGTPQPSSSSQTSSQPSTSPSSTQSANAQPTSAEAQQSTAFINDLISGDTASAYAMTGPVIQQYLSADIFSQSVASLGLGNGCGVTWDQLFGNSAQTMKGVGGQLTCPQTTYHVSVSWGQYYAPDPATAINQIGGYHIWNDTTHVSGDHATVFLEDLIAGDTAAAYAMLHPTLQQWYLTPGQFSSDVASLGVGKDCTVTWASQAGNFTSGESINPTGQLVCPGATYQTAFDLGEKTAPDKVSYYRFSGNGIVVKASGNEEDVFISGLMSGNLAASYALLDDSQQFVNPYSEFTSDIAALNLTPACTTTVADADIQFTIVGTGKQIDKTVNQTITCPGVNYQVSTHWEKPKGSGSQIWSYDILKTK